MIRASMRAFLHGLVDYAGLFPPAKLDMAKAVEMFSKHRASPYAFGLARFVCPATRLNEFAAAALPYLPTLEAGTPVTPGTKSKPQLGRGSATSVVVKPLRLSSKAEAHTPPAESNGQPPTQQPWALSVLIDASLAESLQSIEEFNQSHYRNHHYSALVDTVEIKVVTPDAIDYALDHLPEDLFPFFEIPPATDMRPFAAELAGTGAGAKMRTGGISGDLIPSIEQVADFLMPMAAARVPVKCTAGLHHPLRSLQPLTYEADCAAATMHGFINVFLAACVLHELDVDRATALHLLGETDAKSFVFDDEGVTWRGLRISTERIAEAREGFAHCFGSCSFDDPITDLKKLGLLS
ncbi:MAG: hypothetical protein ACKVS8_00305 [Phycisphaerales bacterium]